MLMVWAAQYVGAAEARGLSLVAASLNVHTPATRGEVVRTVLEVLKLPIAKQKATFSDVPSSHKHADAIATAAFYGIIQGDTADDGSVLGTFRPDDFINRAGVAKMIALLKEVLK